jgi:hypothetical protein
MFWLTNDDGEVINSWKIKHRTFIPYTPIHSCSFALASSFGSRACSEELHNVRFKIDFLSLWRKFLSTWYSSASKYLKEIIKIRSRQHEHTSQCDGPAWLTSEWGAVNSWFPFIDGVSLPTTSRWFTRGGTLHFYICAAVLVGGQISANDVGHLPEYAVGW